MRTRSPLLPAATNDLGGGNVSPDNPAAYTVETPYFTLRNPSREGYTFAGWSGTDIPEGARYFNAGIDQGSSGDRSYTAHWTPVTYSISYNLAGGTASNPANYTPDSAAITLNAPVREHYQFAGWSGTGIAGDLMLSVTVPQGSLGNRSYTAHWTPVSYAISYDLGGGTANPDNPADYTVETPEFALQNPTRAHYDFAGWTGTGLAGEAMTVTIAAGSTGERQYNAHWIPVSYAIDYDLAGGAAANPEAYTVESNDITLNQPVREHYHFAGWSGAGIASDPALTVTIPKGSFGDRSYTAHWIPVSYDIVYDLAGGSVSSANPAGYTVETPGFTLQNPTRAHYDFAGWTGTGLAGETMTVTIAAGSTGERQYNAHWIPVSYTISYDLAGGAAANPEAYTVESNDITLNQPVREHYHFAGWSGAGIASDPALTVTIPKGSFGDRSYTAHWIPVSYDIVYDLAGGAAVNPASYTIESDPITLQNPSRKAYIFTGWTGMNLAGKTFTVTIAAGSVGDRAYAATWEPVVFSGLPGAGMADESKRITTGSYTMNKGESVTWEARPEGGAWSWDGDYFSASFNSPATFKALKAGVSEITYTVSSVTYRINVTITDKALPKTAAGGLWAWLLSGALALLLAAGLWLRARKCVEDKRI